MKPFRVHMVGCLLALIIGSPDYASAAWNNVFQVTCFGRSRQSTSSYYQAPAVAYSSPVVAYSLPVVAFSAPNPCCNPCPQQTCTTQYVQRSYYQPVTTYQSKTYYEPVTSYQTSYYYEPVTSYRYSCYFDPCTCSYKQVAVPATSFQLKAKCSPVQSWVQRCTSVPVTTYQQSFYWEPQTTCCSTNVAPPPCTPAAPAPTTQQPPSVNEQRYSSPPPPAVTEHRQSNTQGNSQYDSYYGQKQNNSGNNQNGGGQQSPSYRQPALGTPEPPTKPSSQSSQPQIRLDRIVSTQESWIQGQVVRDNNVPQGNVRLLFVNADRNNSQQVVTANSAGRFNVPLASGRWLVYMDQPNGRREYHSRIDVTDRRTPFVTLVSR